MSAQGMSEASEASEVSMPTAPRRARKRAAIPVRAMGFPFDASVPRWWFFHDPVVTHFSNALNLLFPDGERFFIRSVKHYLPQIEDAELRERVRGFFGQEGRHGHEHDRYTRLMQEQGYDVEPFLAWYRHLAFEVIEKPVPPALRLAVTAALEHFTATMAQNGLNSDMLDHAHPVMAQLLRWHAAEEIEHKSVAFDVFEEVDGRYWVRALGLLLGFGGLMFFWRAGTMELLRQERARGTDLEAYAEWLRTNPRMIREGQRRGQMFREAILEYLRPGFHPDQRDDYALARGYLESIGRADG